MKNDVCIKSGSYCPICKGVVLSDCRHDSSQFQATQSNSRDSERLEWLMRNVSGIEFRRLGVTYGGNCARDRIDAAMKTPNVEFSGTPAALSPEAPLERRAGPGAQED